MASQLVERAEICKALNLTAKEVDELVRMKQIPHTVGIVKINYEDKSGRVKTRWDKKPGHVLFPLEEILLKIPPKPKASE